MKTIILLIIGAAWASISIGQLTKPADPSKPISCKYISIQHSVSTAVLFDTLTGKQVYLQRSKNQKKIGYIMLGGGAVMMVAGLTLFANNFKLFSSSTEQSDKAATGAVFFTMGGLAALGSIPLFIISANNAHKAAISMKYQPVLLPVQNYYTAKPQPAIGITISL